MISVHGAGSSGEVGRLAAFRREFHRCLTGRGDALFELADALLCGDAPVRSLVELSLVGEHRRGHGSLYAALNRGRIDIARLRTAVAAVPLPRAADGRIVLAVDVTCWLRPEAHTCPERVLCHTYGRGKDTHIGVPGWPYSFVTALEAGRTSWTAPLDARRLAPGDDAATVTAGQLRDVVQRLIAAGQWQSGDPDVWIVADAGYDGPRLAFLLADLPVQVLVRMPSDPGAAPAQRAATASLSVVIVLYTGLAICTVGVLGDTAGDTPVPLIHLLGATGKPRATGTVAVLAVLLTFGASFTFVAAGARAGVSLARDHVLPSRIAVPRHGVPRRSGAVQAAAGAVVAVIAAVAPGIVTVDLLVRVFAALLACVTVVGLAAAVRLLPVAPSRVSAAIAALAVAAIAVLSGPFLLAPAAVAVVVLARLRRAPSPAIAGQAAAPGLDCRAPLGDVRARGTATRVGIR